MDSQKLRNEIQDAINSSFLLSVRLSRDSSTVEVATALAHYHRLGVIEVFFTDFTKLKEIQLSNSLPRGEKLHLILRIQSRETMKKHLNNFLQEVAHGIEEAGAFIPPHAFSGVDKGGSRYHSAA